jgi:CheY-like chemotaxis protein
LLGGSLSVESAAGRGSTFTLTFDARRAPGSDPLDGSLPGMRLLAFLGPGIVGRQVRSLLDRWDVQVVAPPEGDETTAPAGGRYDVIVVDLDASDGGVQAMAVRRRAQWGLQDVPVVAIRRLRTAGAPAGDAGDRAVGTPVRAHALYDALRAAAALPVYESRQLEDTSERRLFAPTDLRILLVEDNDANRRVVRLMLEELGFDVDEVASGFDAITRAQTVAYDVILMDVRMPDLDGLETTRRIKAQHTGECPVIIALTANVMRDEDARCRAAGMDGYLPKPLRLNTRAAVLGGLVAHKS